MNIRNFEIKKKSKRRPYIMFIILYTIIIFSIEPLYRQPLYIYSIELSSSINKSIDLKNYIGVIESFTGLLGNYKTYLILLIIVYNTANIYKTFIFIMTYLLSICISAFLKQVYQLPLMYYNELGIEKGITPLFCYAGWGNPSTFSTCATSVFLTLWKILFENNRLRFKKKAKYISLVIIVIFIITINVCKFFSNLHSLNDILFGDLIGFMIFFFLFYVIQVDLNNGRNLVKLIKIKFIYYILFDLVLFGIYFIFYSFYNSKQELLDKYMTHIDSSKCNYIPYSLRLTEETLIMFIQFFANLGIILGMKCEYGIMFKSNENNWRHYNFAKEENEDDSLLSRISIARETQWNHTNFFISFIRLFIVSLFIAIILLPQAYILNFESNIYVTIFVKMILIWNIFTFSLFFVFKVLLKKLGLTNTSIFALASDKL